MGRDRRREHDERLGGGLEVPLEVALTHHEVDDPRELGIDRGQLGAILTRVGGRDPNDGNILGGVGRLRRVPLQDQDVGSHLAVGDVEFRGEELLDVRRERAVGDRHARDHARARGALDGPDETRHARAARLPQHGVDPCEELGRLERLGDVVGGAARETADLVDHLAARRQEDHRDRRRRAVALDPQTDVVSVGIGEHDVEEDEVREKLFDEGDALTTVVRDRHHHAVRLEPPLQHIGGGVVVFHDDDANRRGVGADGLFRGFHLGSGPLSPRSQRMATMNFEGRSCFVFSCR